MDRNEFLAQADVQAFIKWLIEHLPALPVHLKLRNSKCVAGGLEAKVNGIEAVKDQYQWNGDWQSAKNKLTTLRKNLLSAVHANDQCQTYNACAEILDWGNVPRSKLFLFELKSNGALVNYLTIRRPLLCPNGSQRLSDLTRPLFSKFNSGLTKVHALLDVDGSPIYDGRVGAAIGLLYHLYRKTPAAEKAGPATHCWFAWGPGISEQQSDRIRHIRNPAMLGLGYKGTPMLLSRQSPHIWAQRQVILGWIMRSILEQAALFGGTAVAIAERCHAFEAGLFMMGYDLRALVPNGWNISDPHKKVYPRR